MSETYSFLVKKSVLYLPKGNMNFHYDYINLNVVYLKSFNCIDLCLSSVVNK